MPERYDLLRVDFIDNSGSGLCFAPPYEISIGDTVDTANGRAFVIDRIGYSSIYDSFMKMISGLIPIYRVLFKVIPMAYEEEENDLPKA